MKNLNVLFLALLTSFVIQAEETVITFATCNWEPYYGEELDNGGFFTELIKESFAYEGYSIAVTFMDWSEAVSSVEENRYTGLLGAYHTAEREKVFHYPLPVYEVNIIFISRKELNCKYDGNLHNLKGYRIGVSKGYTNEPAFDSASFLHKIPYSGPEELLQKIVANELDIIVINNDVAKYLLKKNHPNEIVNLKALGPSLAKQLMYIPISRKNPKHKEIVASFNRGLKKLIKEDKVTEIYQKHIKELN